MRYSTILHQACLLTLYHLKVELFRHLNVGILLEPRERIILKCPHLRVLLYYTIIVKIFVMV